MRTVYLAPPIKEHSEPIYKLSSNPHVYEHLSFQNTSLDDAIHFIQIVQEEEKQGKTVSRVILNESNDLVGVTTLMNIDQKEKSCHIGSWLGRDYWGMGYNEAAKRAILSIAFHELGLEKVYVGARIANIRSQKAQEKLLYMTLHVEHLYPDVHKQLEEKEKQPCHLNVVYKKDFVSSTA